MTASAPAKTILFGEHAVVYGEPAIAIPLPSARTSVSFVPNRISGVGFRIHSRTTRMDRSFLSLSRSSALRLLIENICSCLSLAQLPDETLLITSTIPMASGLGSGAALSVAIIRAFMQRFDKTLTNQEISDLAFEIEKIYHGNPSGIDNTVISFEQPLVFQKGQPFRPINTSEDTLDLVVVSSGIRSKTSTVVNDVRAHYAEFAGLIRQIGSLSASAIPALESADRAVIGQLMDENHTLLQAITVSCEELDRMTAFAKLHGALGAKLTGAGRGGNMIALAEDKQHSDALRKAFRKEGMRVIA